MHVFKARQKVGTGRGAAAERKCNFRGCGIDADPQRVSGRPHQPGVLVTIEDDGHKQASAVELHFGGHGQRIPGYRYAQRAGPDFDIIQQLFTERPLIGRKPNLLERSTGFKKQRAGRQRACTHEDRHVRIRLRIVKGQYVEGVNNLHPQEPVRVCLTWL